jgi:hypothetical protein
MGLPTRIEVLAISLSCGLGDRATLCRPLGNRRSWLVYRTKFSSGRMPTSGFIGHNCGCHIAGPPTLPRNRLWVFPCLGALHQEYFSNRGRQFSGWGVRAVRKLLTEFHSSRLRLFLLICSAYEAHGNVFFNYLHFAINFCIFHSSFKFDFLFQYSIGGRCLTYLPCKCSHMLTLQTITQ